MCLAATLVWAAAEGDSAPNRSAARQLFTMVNEARAKDGLRPLQWDDRLAAAALEHAKVVAQRKQLSHQFAGEPPLNLRLARTNIRLDRSGENLALDSTVEGAHEGLLKSPRHRANILNRDFNAIGIAVVRAGGDLWVVQDFAHRLSEESAGQFENEIASEFDRLRRESGAAPLKRLDLGYLRNSACAMAGNDSLDAQVSVPAARFVITFTITEPQKLPADVTRFRSDNKIAQYGLGACFERSRTYPNGVYWVVMTLFPKKSATATWRLVSGELWKRSSRQANGNRTSWWGRLDGLTRTGKAWCIRSS